jgi:hypothetical protein
MHNHLGNLKRAGQPMVRMFPGSHPPPTRMARHARQSMKEILPDQQAVWIIQRHVVRECGVVIEGPDPKTLIDYVSPDDIRGAIMGILDEWWFPMLDDASWLRDHDNHYRAFAVTTMCRVLHALKHGTIVSKPKAAQWTLANVGQPWQELIERSIAVSNHEDLEITLDETLDFIRYTKENVKR